MTEVSNILDSRPFEIEESTQLSCCLLFTPPSNTCCTNAALEMHRLCIDKHRRVRHWCWFKVQRSVFQPPLPTNGSTRYGDYDFITEKVAHSVVLGCIIIVASESW